MPHPCLNLDEPFFLIIICLGFWTGGSAAMLDLQSIKSYMTPLGMTIGQCNLSVAATASVGGFTYGLLGSKTYSNDILVSLFLFLAMKEPVNLYD